MALDYSNTFARIYTSAGSLWQAPNYIWEPNFIDKSNSIWKVVFAKNKKGSDLHPAIVEKIKSDSFTVQLAPGTSKDYNIGSCVFKTKLKNSEKTSYFLLKLSMPYIINNLLKLNRGWNNQNELGKKEHKDLMQQIKMCKG